LGPSYDSVLEDGKVHESLLTIQSALSLKTGKPGILVVPIDSITWPINSLIQSRRSWKGASDSTYGARGRNARTIGNGEHYRAI